MKIDVSIRYDQDLLKAKRVLEAVMTEDARVKTKPGPMVYVLNLASSSCGSGGALLGGQQGLLGRPLRPAGKNQAAL